MMREKNRGKPQGHGLLRKPDGEAGTVGRGGEEEAVSENYFKGTGLFRKASVSDAVASFKLAASKSASLDSSDLVSLPRFRFRLGLDDNAIKVVTEGVLDPPPAVPLAGVSIAVMGSSSIWKTRLLSSCAASYVSAALAFFAFTAPSISAVLPLSCDRQIVQLQP